MLAVHSGHRSTSVITDHTIGLGAGISTVMLKWIRLMARIQLRCAVIIRARLSLLPPNETTGRRS
jgi:hypothetical protein